MGPRPSTGTCGALVASIFVLTACVAPPIGATAPPSSAEPPGSPPTACEEGSPSLVPESDCAATSTTLPVEVDTLPEDQADRAIDLALADSAVQARLDGTRFRALYVWPGAPDTPAAKESLSPYPHVVVYDYTNDRWLEVPVDLATETVRPFYERDPAVDGTPALSPDEAAEAVNLALTDSMTQEFVGEGYTADERSVHWGGWEGVPCVTARCLLVVLEREGYEAVYVQVDIGAGAVVALRDD